MLKCLLKFSWMLPQFSESDGKGLLTLFVQIDFIFSHLTNNHPSPSPVLSAMTGAQWGYIDRSGKFAISPSYEGAAPFFARLPFMIAFALFCAGCDEGSGTQPGREAMNIENPSIHIHAASHTPFDEIREAPLH